MKELHLWDLPYDRVYVKLEESFQEKIILGAKYKYGSWPKLAEQLDCNSRSVMNWANSKNFMPLSLLIKIASITGVELEIIENQIKAIATGRKTKINGKRGEPVYNIKFPIKITPELARVLARFMGDGCIKVSWYYDSVYYNKEDTLINAMIEDVKSVFGDMKVSVTLDRGTKCVRFPNIVGLIIVTMFGEVGTLKARIPQDILDSTEDIKLAFLGAYFDDEGTVDSKHPLARYYTANEVTSNSLANLLANVGIRTGAGKSKYIGRSKENFMYHVNITGKNNVRNFALKIKPLHKRKRGLLLSVLER